MSKQATPETDALYGQLGTVITNAEYDRMFALARRLERQRDEFREALIRVAKLPRYSSLHGDDDLAVAIARAAIAAIDGAIDAERMAAGFGEALALTEKAIANP